VKSNGCQVLSRFGLQSKNLVNQLRLAKQIGYLSDQDSSAVFLADSSVIEPKIVEAEKVPNSLI